MHDAMAQVRSYVKPGLRQIDESLAIDEAEKIKLPPHLAKFFDNKGNLKKDVAARVAKGQTKVNWKVTDVTPKGYGPAEEGLDKEDEKSVDGVIKQLKKAVKAHQSQVDSLTKDIKDEFIIDEAMDNWKVTVVKPVNKLKKGDSVSVKANNISQALKKSAKAFGDSGLAAVPSTHFDVQKEETIFEASGLVVARNMTKIKTMRAFANKVAKMKNVTRDDLEKILPDYIAGADITKVMSEEKVPKGYHRMPDGTLMKDDEMNEAYSPQDIKMAIGIASDKRYAGGNMTGAVNAIEKMKKGLSKHPQVMAVLKRQNEDLDEATINLDDHDKDDNDFQKLIKKLKLKATTMPNDDGTIVNGKASDIEKMLNTMYGATWKKMYKLKGDKYVEEAVSRIVEPYRPEFGIDEGKFSELDAMIKQGKSAEEIARAMKLDLKLVKTMMKIGGSESVEEQSDAAIIYAYNEQKLKEAQDRSAREFINPLKELMVVRESNFIVINKNDKEIYLNSGWNLVEDTRITEKKDLKGYDLYHNDFSGAMQHAYAAAKKQGFTVDPESIDSKVATGPRKPSKGKTNSYTLDLSNSKKKLRVQVFGMDSGKYELNMYVEAVGDTPDDDGQDLNIMMQLRKSISLRGLKDVEFMDGKKVKVDPKIAQAVQTKFNRMRTSIEKGSFQKKIAKSYKDLLQALKEK